MPKLRLFSEEVVETWRWLL